jgi:hypothetical protein
MVKFSFPMWGHAVANYEHKTLTEHATFITKASSKHQQKLLLKLHCQIT